MSEEAWLEAFERDLVENEDQAYLKYTKDITLRDDLTDTVIAADPMILMNLDMTLFSHQRLDVFLRTVRYWRWKSRHYYEPISSQSEFPQVLERQDTALLRSLFVKMSKLVEEYPKHIQMIQMICTLMNSIFLETPHQIKLLLMSCAIPPEALSFCIEHIPSFSLAVDMLPELLSKDTSTKSPSYIFYYADLASWLATKYANPRFEAFIPQITVIFGQTKTFDSCIAALTIGIRLCVAIPQLCLLTLHPQLLVIGQIAQRLAVDQDKLSCLESRMAQILAVLDVSAGSNDSFCYSCKI